MKSPPYLVLGYTLNLNSCKCAI